MGSISILRGLCFGIPGSIAGRVKDLAGAAGGASVTAGDYSIVGAAPVGMAGSIRRAPNPGLAACVVVWKVNKMPLIGSCDA